MNCPVCGSELLFNRCDVKVYRCGYALSTFSELPTIEQPCGTQPTAAEPPRPRCETCPCYDGKGVCRRESRLVMYTRENKVDRVMECSVCDYDYCSYHPGYEVWSKWEYNRRLRETGGEK